MRRVSGLVLLLLIALVSLAACSTTRPDPAAATDAQVATIGDAAASTLATGLGQRVQEALQQGPVAAMGFCTAEAQPLTRSIEQDLGQNLTVKRTSLQYRNPINAPDAFEVAALLHFQEALATQGALPDYYIQQVSAGEYRYYKPMLVADWCLSCHGDPAQFDPALQQALNENYPDDLATGYQAGDFRGLIRVSIPAEQVQQ